MSKYKMKSLKKAIDVLEFVLNQDGRPVTPSMIGSELGLDASNCVRVLDVFLSRGYVEKVSRHVGYVAGPALFGLAVRDCSFSRIVKASSAPLKDLAVNTSSMVNISVMSSGRRYILNYYSANPMRMPVSSSGYYMDHYVTATGRLLMSTLADDEVDSIVEAIGLPGKLWTGVKDRNGLYRALNKIRKDGTVCYKESPYWIIGGLVHGESCPPAAIGFGINEAYAPEKALEHTLAAARSIEDALKVKSEFR